LRTPTDILPELKDYQAWRAGKTDFDLIDYAMCTGTPDALCSFFELTDPDLVVHEGEYFLAHQFKIEVYESWKERLKSIEEIQRVMNHVHVSSLLQGQEISDAVAKFVAEQLANAWRRAFADRGLTVEAYGTNLHDAQVTFFRGIGSDGGSKSQ